MEELMNKNRRDITFIRIQKESLYEPVSLSINGENFTIEKMNFFLNSNKTKL